MDVLLAFVHHLAAFGAIAAQAVETTALRSGLDAARIERLVKVDRLYVVSLALVVVAGFARVLAGPKGAAFYTGNAVFWAKLALVAAIAALAWPPARRFRAWRDAARADGAFVPADAEVAATRRHVVRAAHVVVGVLLTATLMARGIGF
jgi:putative membrane protein